MTPAPMGIRYFNAFSSAIFAPGDFRNLQAIENCRTNIGGILRDKPHK
jgi:hypothetical protein